MRGGGSLLFYPFITTANDTACTLLQKATMRGHTAHFACVPLLLKINGTFRQAACMHLHVLPKCFTNSLSADMGHFQAVVDLLKRQK